MAGPTLDQQGDTTREAFLRGARANRAAALQAAGDERRMRKLLIRGGAAPAEGAAERTGLGTGYSPLAEDPQMERHGRGYSDITRWTEDSPRWPRIGRRGTQGSRMSGAART